MEKSKQCYFCTNGFKSIDYKDIETLKKFLSPHASVVKSRKTSNCALHQRKMVEAVKRARHLALIPFVER